MWDSIKVRSSVHRRFKTWLKHSHLPSSRVFTNGMYSLMYLSWSYMVKNEHL